MLITPRRLSTQTDWRMVAHMKHPDPALDRIEERIHLILDNSPSMSYQGLTAEQIQEVKDLLQDRHDYLENRNHSQGGANVVPLPH